MFWFNLAAPGLPNTDQGVSEPGPSCLYWPVFHQYFKGDPRCIKLYVFDPESEEEGEEF